MTGRNIIFPLDLSVSVINGPERGREASALRHVIPVDTSLPPRPQPHSVRQLLPRLGSG